MSWLSAIYGFFYEILFDCSHRNLTRPFTLRAHSYKVCTDCGRQFPYSLDKMRLLHSWEIERQPATVAAIAPVAMASVSVAREEYSTKAVA